MLQTTPIHKITLKGTPESTTSKYSISEGLGPNMDLHNKQTPSSKLHQQKRPCGSSFLPQDDTNISTRRAALETTLDAQLSPSSTPFRLQHQDEKTNNKAHIKSTTALEFAMEASESVTEASNFTFKTADGIDVFTYCWLPQNPKNIKGVVQIAHGMAEHALRYERFAKFLNSEGYAVYANDHRGHGKTAGSVEKLGYFADHCGWELVVGDMAQLTGIIKENHKGQPVYLFGHSLGSMLSRSYAAIHGENLQGLILSGTGGDPGFMLKVGKVIAGTIAKIKGKKAQSPLLDMMSFGEFNKAFKPARTKSDWLSRDEQEVDKYLEDPYCGTIFSAGFFQDLLHGVKLINDPETYKSLPTDLPVYLFSGEKDPVGNNTKGVLEVIEQMKRAGLEDISHKFYKDGRHEMLNETNRGEVHQDIASWLNRSLKWS